MITEVKKKPKLEGFKGRSEQSEESISELEDTAMEMITETKRFKEKQTEPKRPFGHHQQTNLCIVGEPEEEDREKGREDISKNNS